MDTAAAPALYVIPSPLGPGLGAVPADTRVRLLQIRHFVVENLKPTRQYLAAVARAAGIGTDFIGDCLFHLLAEDTPEEHLAQWLLPVAAGHAVGLLSDAGCPGIADPGARLVAAAHRRGIPVQPLAGPSSFFLALMASGLPGQQFAFSGYVPVEARARQQALQRLEAQSRQQKATQLFMDTPYRNEALLRACLDSLQPHTLLCVAADLSLPAQWVHTAPVSQWKHFACPALNKRPAVFLIYAGVV
ncbi:MAG: SAM-dependent methyltransferase [Bacteroidetes bacterium]|nr:SAM-dependent methyltransferase [Bacteroidota bacterium]